jgi:hypothetical protein
MAFQEGFRGLGRERHYEAVVRVRQIHGQIVRPLFHSRNHDQCFAEIHLRLAGRMCQRHEYLSAVQCRCAHVVLHDRVAARETVLFLKPLEDPLRRMPLLGWSLLVVVQNGVNDAQPWPQLRTLDRLLALVPTFEPSRWAVHATLEFNVLVGGPVLIGAGRFLGMGLMKPAQQPEKESRE